MRKASTLRLVVTILPFILALTGCARILSSQTHVQGEVTYSDGTPIQGAVVYLDDQETVTDEHGLFEFENVNKGTYTLRVVLDGEQIDERVVVVSRGTVKVTVTVERERTNLLRNGDFELGANESGVPLHWTLYTPNPDAYSIISDEYASSGQYSVKIVDPSTTYATGVSSERHPATADETYRAQVDIYCIEGTFFMLFLEFHDDTKRLEAITERITGPSTEWQTLTVEGTAPEGTTKVGVLLYSGTGHVGTAYFDNARLEKIN